MRARLTFRQLCHTATDGTSLKALCRAATELGLAARALKVSLRNLPHLPLPAIIHWEGNHWMVLYDVDEKFVRVADPASGLRRIPRKEFEQKWSGYAALFDYTIAFEQTPESKATLTWLLPFFAKFRRILLQVLLLAVAVSILSLLFPVFTEMVVDKVIVEKDIGLLKTILLGMGAVLFFVQASSLAQEYLLSFAAVRLDTAILDFLSRQLLSLPMTYFTSRRTGDIQRRLDGARQVRQFAVGNGVGALLALIQLTGALCLMLIYSASLTLAFLATTPLYGGLMYFSRRVLRPLFADVEENQGKYSSHQIDAIKGIEAVKAAAAESVFRDTMLNEFLSVSKKIFRSSFIMMSYDSVLTTIGMLSTAIFLWVGANQVISGQLSIGGFVAFSSLTAMAYAGIMRTLGIWDNMQFASVLLNRLNDIFEQEPEQGHDRSRLTPVHSLEGRIELRNISFKYGGPESPDILKGITMDIAPGRMVALVGRSGCGKTTLIKLIAGLLEPTEGTILFDNVDLKSLSYRDVRRHIGMVLQENHIFNETIARNISFGDAEPDLDRFLWTFLARAVHDFRAPLTAISGYCGLLLGEPLGPLTESQREVLRRMQHSTKRLSRMATAMFHLSIGRHVKRQLDLQRGDIRECLEQALHEIAPLADDKAIEITTDLAPCDSLLYFEAGQIEQVLINLLDNASKFAPRAGIVELRGYPYFWERRATKSSIPPAAERRRHTVLQPNAYRIDIRDSGNAIPAAHIDHIFEEYTSYAGRDRSGGGLGLAISRLIVDQHNGRVWAENTGFGPMFSIVLPAHVAEAIHAVKQLQETA